MMKLVLLPLVIIIPVAAAIAASISPSYHVVAGWPAYPTGVKSGDGSGIAVNHRGEVLALHRGNRPWAAAELVTDPINGPVVMVFDAKSGRLLRQWGTGMFAMPHGISVDAGENVWITDVALHQVYKFSPDGKLLLALGERGVPGNDKEHFNRPTDVLSMPDGSFYVADGYRNTRVVKFTADGKFTFQWGAEGKGPGQLETPHSLALGSDGRIYVCDRNNSRVQIFDADGRFIAQFALPDLGRPFAIATLGPDRFAVAGNGLTPGKADTAAVDIIDGEGRVLSSFGSFGPNAGQFIGVHDITVDDHGDLYVADVKGQHFQKFAPERR